MTNKEAIKYLQQIYPNGGHCWLDEQRIEAIGMAVNALQEEPVSEDIERAIVEKAIEKIDMDALTDKIAEIVADRIIKKEFPTVPSGVPWTAPSPRTIEPIVAMYACIPVDGTNTPFTDFASLKKEEL